MYRWRFTIKVYCMGFEKCEEKEEFNADNRELAGLRATDILTSKNANAKNGEKYEWYDISRISS